MSTRSMICKETQEGKYEGIYCHSDGYLTYNGAMLLDYYNSKERVDELLSIGDISCLLPKIKPNPLEEHSFDNRQEDVCVAYGRDRGEIGTEAKEVSLEDINNPASWIEYCYVFGLDNKWKFFECDSNKKIELKSLQEGLDEEYKRLGFPRPEGIYGFYSPSEIKQYQELQKQKEAEAE